MKPDGADLDCNSAQPLDPPHPGGAAMLLASLSVIGESRRWGILRAANYMCTLSFWLWTKKSMQPFLLVTGE